MSGHNSTSQFLLSLLPRRPPRAAAVFDHVRERDDGDAVVRAGEQVFDELDGREPERAQRQTELQALQTEQPAQQARGGADGLLGDLVEPGRN